MRLFLRIPNLPLLFQVRLHSYKAYTMHHGVRQLLLLVQRTIGNMCWLVPGWLVQYQEIKKELLHMILQSNHYKIQNHW